MKYSVNKNGEVCRGEKQNANEIWDIGALK